MFQKFQESNETLTIINKPLSQGEALSGNIIKV